MNRTTGIARLRKDLFAFNMELGTGYKLIEGTFFEHEKCDFIEIQYITATTVWVTAQKRSPYKEIFKTRYILINTVFSMSKSILSYKALLDYENMVFNNVMYLECIQLNQNVRRVVRVFRAFV